LRPCDHLEATHWNFTWVAAVRFDLGMRDKVIELGVRHWPKRIRASNRGENLLALSLGF
jgi:hypothetical protein